MITHSRRLAAGTLLCALAFAFGACGDDEDETAGGTRSGTSAAASDLAAIKGYLLDHTARLQREAHRLRGQAERYHALAAGAGFDHAALLRSRRDDVRELVRSMQRTFAAANPAYEEMEGVVAGVPELADYDVIIDAGGDASDPENAVPFSIETPDGRTFEQPGNFNYLIETSVFGTEPKFAARGVKQPDLDGDGRVEFGEAVPDANFLVAAARDFERNVDELAGAAEKWRPTPQDAFTALVVMTPTMSEYFEAWKNSRFVSGDKATEKAFVVASRLQDIGDILGGLNLIYDNVKPRIARVDPGQADQTGRELRRLRSFAERLHGQEQRGRRFTAEDAETLGSEAQDRAEAIAGQVSQAAGKLKIRLEN